MRDVLPTTRFFGINRLSRAASSSSVGMMALPMGTMRRLNCGVAAPVYPLVATSAERARNRPRVVVTATCPDSEMTSVAGA